MSNVHSQDYFVKRVDFDDESNNPAEVICYEGRIFTLVGHFCSNLECSSLVELTSNGDTLWRVPIPEIDPAFESIIIDSDTITIVGNNDPANTHYRMAHFDLEGNKINETMEIFHPTEIFTRSFQLTFQKINNRFYIMGVAEREGDSHALCYKVDNKGNLDTLVILARAGERATIWDSGIDSEGNLVTFHKIEEPFEFLGQIRINKFDANLDSVWRYDAQDVSIVYNGTRGDILESGEIVFKSFDPNQNSDLETLRIVDEENNERIVYLPPDSPTNSREFAKVKVLNNGDILGLGVFQDVSISPEVNRAPWMIRLSPEGEIRWQRVFFDIDPSDGEARSGVVRDVLELPNGDLYGVGDIRYDFRTTFLFKVDSNGCLNPGDCGLLNFITSTDQLDPIVGLEVYPNPATEYINIRLEDDQRDLQYMLIDNMGRVVKNLSALSASQHIESTEFSNGTYYLLIMQNGVLVAREKIAVE